MLGNESHLFIAQREATNLPTHRGGFDLQGGLRRTGRPERPPFMKGKEKEGGTMGEDQSAYVTERGSTPVDAPCNRATCKGGRVV